VENPTVTTTAGYYMGLVIIFVYLITLSEEGIVIILM